jgi:urate oxidase
VRLTKVARHPDGLHDLKELSVEILLTGDFAQTYLTGDNTGIVATDSMKNTVYVLAKKDPIDSIESFGAALAAHFVQTYPQVSGATVSVEQSLWHRIDHNGKRARARVRCRRQ